MKYYHNTSEVISSRSGQSVLVLILLWIFFSCNYRTPGDKRFETNIGFELPEDKSVLKDEYQDMQQDYAVIYEVKLPEPSNKQFAAKIRSMVAAQDTATSCRWLFTDRGFSYSCEKNRTVYSVNYDTIKGLVTYNEASD